MSYLERTLIWFLKNRIFGGIEKLKEKEYLLFTITIVTLLSSNTVLAILFRLNFFITQEFMQTMLVFQLFISFAILLSGFLIGRVKNLTMYYLISLILIIIFTIAFFVLNWTFDHIVFQYMKLLYFIVWVAISCLSLFFLTLYFFTSFSKKIITLGIPRDHIFFGSIIKIVAYISIPFYIYLIFQLKLGNLILGILGIVNALIVLFLVYRAPNKQESVPGIINFATAVGFFNVITFYHLIMSFELTSNNESSFIIDIILLYITILYLVQSITRRVSEAPSRIVPFDSTMKFQSRLYFTDGLKKIFGEQGIVLISMGLAIGYHMVTLDSFFMAGIPVLYDLFTPNREFSVIYHKIYLLFSFGIILVATLMFMLSKRSKEFMVDKYTFTQVLKYITGFFQSENGSAPIDVGLQIIGKKIGEGIKSLGDKFRDSFQNKTDRRDEKENI